jgi:hypothetical protein
LEQRPTQYVPHFRQNSRDQKENDPAALDQFKASKRRPPVARDGLQEEHAVKDNAFRHELRDLIASPFPARFGNRLLKNRIDLRISQSTIPNRLVDGREKFREGRLFDFLLDELLQVCGNVLTAGGRPLSEFFFVVGGQG